MPDEPASKPINLSTYTEATRRAVYDAVVAIYFSPTPEEFEEARADPDDHFVVTYTPDEAGLKIHHEFGRWFATWIRLETPPEIPEESRRELRVEEKPGAPFGIMLYEV
ncbi:MAG TPA: hypothetical protein VOA87_16925 [Thermoanaerobaculia bacterium]|nr:hypothetical protein [Thermoanaerobaculia bacterium]